MSNFGEQLLKRDEIGDALHAISCAAGYNLSWLLRAVAWLGLGPIFLGLLQALLHSHKATIGLSASPSAGNGGGPVSSSQQLQQE